jgi:hypothetical protein
MGHMIEALIATSAPAGKATLFDGAITVALPPPVLFLVPLTDALWIREVSSAGRVAYIETEYFGGIGEQAAAVWEDGRLIMPATLAPSGPINEALKLLGVQRTATQDEFDVAGLGRHRRTTDWLAK